MYLTVNGGWSLWASWSSCSATCGDSQKIRKRFCDNPPPSGGGSNCSGNSSQQQTCDTKDCPGKIKLSYVYYHPRMSYPHMCLFVYS